MYKSVTDGGFRADPNVKQTPADPKKFREQIQERQLSEAMEVMNLATASTGATFVLNRRSDKDHKGKWGQFGCLCTYKGIVRDAFDDVPANAVKEAFLQCLWASKNCPVNDEGYGLSEFLRDS